DRASCSGSTSPGGSRPARGGVPGGHGRQRRRQLRPRWPRRRRRPCPTAPAAPARGGPCWCDRAPLPVHHRREPVESQGAWEKTGGAWAADRDRVTCATYEKRLCERGVVAWRTLEPGQEAGPWIEDFLALEASGWKGRAGSAFAWWDAKARFARAGLAAAAERGRLRISGIDCDEHPVARLVIFTAGGGSFAFKTAYDESYKRCAPGILEEVHNIRAFHENGGKLDWMDSYTEAGNSVTDRMWKDRLVIVAFAVGLTPRGRLACAALPLVRLARGGAAFLRRHANGRSNPPG